MFKQLTISFIPVFLMIACIKVSISPHEKLLLINENVFKNYGIEFSEFDRGEYSKTSYFDNSTELKYTFKGIAKDSTYLYISNIINVFTSEEEAEKKYKAENSLIKISPLISAKFIRIENDQLNEKAELYLWMIDNQPAGNLFRFQKNEFSYYLLIGGIYFETAKEWEQFFRENTSPVFH